MGSSKNVTKWERIKWDTAPDPLCPTLLTPRCNQLALRAPLSESRVLLLPFACPGCNLAAFEIRRDGLQGPPWSCCLLPNVLQNILLVVCLSFPTWWQKYHLVCTGMWQIKATEKATLGSRFHARSCSWHKLPLLAVPCGAVIAAPCPAAATLFDCLAPMAWTAQLWVMSWTTLWV